MDFFLSFSPPPTPTPVAQHINSPGFGISGILLFLERWGKFELLWLTTCSGSFPMELTRHPEEAACPPRFPLNTAAVWVVYLVESSPMWTPNFSWLHTGRMALRGASEGANGSWQPSFVLASGAWRGLCLRLSAGCSRATPSAEPPSDPLSCAFPSLHGACSDSF